MTQMSDISEVHKAIGEFVVFFQSIEDMYRRLGWFILDPEKKNWPPMQLRRESNRDLVDKVTDLFIELTRGFEFPNGAEKATEAEELRTTFHKLRKYRNRIAHSSYFEVKAGGKVVAVMRTNPEVQVDSETGEVIFDEETFTPDIIRREVSIHAVAMFKLHALQMQTIHWHPFERYARKA